MSCVRASGRGEAVWACEGAIFPNAGAQNGKMFSGGGSGSGFVFSFLLLCSWVFWLFEPFRCYAHGFFDWFSFLLLCSWVVWSVCVFAGMFMGFLMCLYTFLVFAAMLMGLLIFLCFCWYAHGFCDVFAPLARCVLCSLFLLDLVLFLLVYSWICLMCLHTLFVLAAMLPS